MTDHRKTIESLVADFTTHAARGSLHKAATVLPTIVGKLLDFIEHATGTAEAPKHELTTSGNLTLSGNLATNAVPPAPATQEEDDGDNEPVTEVAPIDVASLSVPTTPTDVAHLSDVTDAPAAPKQDTEETVTEEPTISNEEAEADTADKKPAKAKKTKAAE